MIVKELLVKERQGLPLDEAEIRFLVAGIADGGLDDAQIAAFAMAVCCRGMSRQECAALTFAMARSGTVLDWAAERRGRPVIDKHSTGGIGDKTSLMLAPIAAAAGALVPMIAGRGLGHTGGTLDKLDAIPGYETRPSLERFKAAVAAVGTAIVGQTAELVPADRRLYAVRDETGTVESVPLLTSSILSKKLAEGLDGLVLDVKCGSGAFMTALDDAIVLARSLTEVAAGAGLKTAALVTDMDEVLGASAGNALEVAEAIEYLTGTRREPRLDHVTRALAAEMLLLGALAADAGEAAARVEAALSSGAAAECFGRMVAALGGPADLVERYGEHLPTAPVVRPVFPLEPGFVRAVDARRVGLAVLSLGGGRQRPGDPIDYAVGLSEAAPIGSAVDGERPLALVHARDEAAAEAAAAELRRAVTLGDAPPPRPVILQRL